MLLGALWDKLPEHNKTKYHHEASMLREEHRQSNPDQYKRPQRKRNATEQEKPRSPTDTGLENVSTTVSSIGSQSSSPVTSSMLVELAQSSAESNLSTSFGSSTTSLAPSTDVSSPFVDLGNIDVEAVVAELVRIEPSGGNFKLTSAPPGSDDDQPYTNFGVTTTSLGTQHMTTSDSYSPPPSVPATVQISGGYAFPSPPESYTTPQQNPWLPNSAASGTFYQDDFNTMNLTSTPDMFQSLREPWKLMLARDKCVN